MARLASVSRLAQGTALFFTMSESTDASCGLTDGRCIGLALLATELHIARPIGARLWGSALRCTALGAIRVAERHAVLHRSEHALGRAQRRIRCGGAQARLVRSERRDQPRPE